MISLVKVTNFSVQKMKKIVLSRINNPCAGVSSFSQPSLAFCWMTFLVHPDSKSTTKLGRVRIEGCQQTCSVY